MYILTYSCLSNQWLPIISNYSRVSYRELGISTIGCDHIEKVTCNKRKPLHGRKWMISRRVQNVQLVDLTSNPIELSREILDGGSIRVAVFIIQKPVRIWKDHAYHVLDWSCIPWRRFSGKLISYLATSDDFPTRADPKTINRKSFWLLVVCNKSSDWTADWVVDSSIYTTDAVKPKTK